MRWMDTIEKVGPNNLLEIPDVRVYNANLEQFSKGGFTPAVFNRLLPILEQQVFSAFSLFSLARGVPDGGRIVEIGGGRGGSMALLALAHQTANLFTVDPFIPYDETSAHGTVHGYKGFSREQYDQGVARFKDVIGERLIVIQESSETAHKQFEDMSIDLLFVDGNHSYGPVKNDLKRWACKVKPNGGILCGHDYHPRFPGVIAAVKEEFGEHYDVMNGSSIWVFYPDTPDAVDTTPPVKPFQGDVDTTGEHDGMTYTKADDFNDTSEPEADGTCQATGEEE